MIAAIGIEKPSLKATIASRFARAPHYAIVDFKNSELQIIANPHVSEESGLAGKAIRLLGEEHACNSFIAYELGAKLKIAADQKNMQLIIIDRSLKSLDVLLNLHKPNEGWKLL